MDISNLHNNQFLVGSRTFFNNYEDFIPHDTDILEFDDSLKEIWTGSTKDNITIIKWKYSNANKIIDCLLNCPVITLKCGMLLTPKVIKYTGMTFELLPQLQPLIDKLDDRHKYIEVIYNAYLENGKFELTKEQLDSAYEEYKRERPNVYNK